MVAAFSAAVFSAQAEAAGIVKVKVDSGALEGTINADASVRIFRGVPSRRRPWAICAGVRRNR